jgi:hypothetical protein
MAGSSDVVTINASLAGEMALNQHQPSWAINKNILKI